MVSKATSVTAVLVLVFSMVLVLPAQGDEATIRLTGGTVGVGLGITWADGVLVYQGKEYPITAQAFTLGDVGAATMDAKGIVSDLKSLEDFNGNYGAITAGATVGAGRSATTMMNENGVGIVMTSAHEGVRFTLAHSGMRISLKRTEGSVQAASK